MDWMLHIRRYKCETNQFEIQSLKFLNYSCTIWQRTKNILILWTVLLLTSQIIIILQFSQTRFSHETFPCFALNEHSSCTNLSNCSDSRKSELKSSITVIHPKKTRRLPSNPDTNVSRFVVDADLNLNSSRFATTEIHLLFVTPGVVCSGENGKMRRFN